MPSLLPVHHHMFSLLHPLIQMPPHPSYPCAYYSDHNRHHYHNHQSVTSRRCLPFFARRNDARPHPPPSPAPLINDSFFWSANIPPQLDRPVTSFAKVVASTNSSRPSRMSSGSPSTNSHPQLPPHSKHQQIPKTTLCEFWRRGEVCRFGSNCWYSHGPVQPRTNATDENRLLTGDNTNPQNAEQVEQEQTVESNMNQFTPEQQQWMYLSQRAQTFLPLPQNLMAARFKELSQKTGTVAEVSMPGRTCEEIEREQTASKFYSAAAQRADSLQSSSTSGSYSSGPTTPPNGINQYWHSPAFEALKEKALAQLANLLSNMKSDPSDVYLIPFEKEECPLYRYGQCPFGSLCFFEHPGEEDEGIYSDS